MRLEGKIRQCTVLETGGLTWSLWQLEGESSKLIRLETLGVEEQGVENEACVHVSCKMEGWYFCLFAPDVLGSGRGQGAHSVSKVSPKFGKFLRVML